VTLSTPACAGWEHAQERWWCSPLHRHGPAASLTPSAQASTTARVECLSVASRHRCPGARLAEHALQHFECLSVASRHRCPGARLAEHALQHYLQGDAATLGHHHAGCTTQQHAHRKPCRSPRQHSHHTHSTVQTKRTAPHAWHHAHRTPGRSPRQHSHHTHSTVQTKRTAPHAWHHTHRTPGRSPGQHDTQHCTNKTHGTTRTVHPAAPQGRQDEQRARRRWVAMAGRTGIPACRGRHAGGRVVAALAAFNGGGAEGWASECGQPLLHGGCEGGESVLSADGSPRYKGQSLQAAEGGCEGALIRWRSPLLIPPMAP